MFIFAYVFLPNEHTDMYDISSEHEDPELDISAAFGG